MPSFQERERAEEAHYAKERELAFRVRAHRNRLLALWAAAKMGLTGERAQLYAVEFVRDEIVVHEDEAVVARLRDDFLIHGVPVSREEIQLHLAQFAARTVEEINGHAPTVVAGASKR